MWRPATGSKTATDHRGQRNATRGKRRKAAPGRNGVQAARRQDEDGFTRRTRLSWAKLIHRVSEVDPLLCPFCGGEMKILAFILNFGAARATAKSLKLPAQDPEPLAHAPPEALELVAESARSWGLPFCSSALPARVATSRRLRV